MQWQRNSFLSERHKNQKKIPQFLDLMTTLTKRVKFAGTNRTLDTKDTTKPITKERIEAEIGLSSRLEQCFLPSGHLDRLPRGLFHTKSRSIDIGDRVVKAAGKHVANLKEFMTVVSKTQEKGELWMNVTFEKVSNAFTEIGMRTHLNIQS